MLTTKALYAKQSENHPDPKKRKKMPERPYHWIGQSVAGILERMEYTGCTCNFKTYSKSYKLKKRIPNAVNGQVKDALDYWGGILVNDPMVFIGGISAIAIGRFSQMLSAGAFLTEYDPDFFAGVPWIPFVEQITNSGKAVAVTSFTVHTIIDGDKTHVVAGENDVTNIDKGTKGIAYDGGSPSDFPFDFYLFVCRPCLY